MRGMNIMNEWKQTKLLNEIKELNEMNKHYLGSRNVIKVKQINELNENFEIN